MFIHKNRLSIKILAGVIAGLLLLNDSSWSLPEDTCPHKTSTLAAELRLKPFFDANNIDFEHMYALGYTAAELRDILNERLLRDSDVARINGKFRNGEVLLEKVSEDTGYVAVRRLDTGRIYQYVVYDLKKEGIKIKALFPDDPATLTEAEKIELGIKTESDADHFALSGIWFVKLDESRQGRYGAKEGQLHIARIRSIGVWKYIKLAVYEKNDRYFIGCVRSADIMLRNLNRAAERSPAILADPDFREALNAVKAEGRIKNNNRIFVYEPFNGICGTDKPGHIVDHEILHMAQVMRNDDSIISGNRSILGYRDENISLNRFSDFVHSLPENSEANRSLRSALNEFRLALAVKNGATVPMEFFAWIYSIEKYPDFFDKLQKYETSDDNEKEFLLSYLKADNGVALKISSSCKRLLVGVQRCSGAAIILKEYYEKLKADTPEFEISAPDFSGPAAVSAGQPTIEDLYREGYSFVIEDIFDKEEGLSFKNVKIFKNGEQVENSRVHFYPVKKYKTIVMRQFYPFTDLENANGRGRALQRYLFNRPEYADWHIIAFKPSKYYQKSFVRTEEWDPVAMIEEIDADCRRPDYDKRKKAFMSLREKMIEELVRKGGRVEALLADAWSKTSLYGRVPDIPWMAENSKPADAGIKDAENAGKEKILELDTAFFNAFPHDDENEYRTKINSYVKTPNTVPASNDHMAILEAIPMLPIIPEYLQWHGLETAPDENTPGKVGNCHQGEVILVKLETGDDVLGSLYFDACYGIAGKVKIKGKPYLFLKHNNSSFKNSSIYLFIKWLLEQADSEEDFECVISIYGSSINEESYSDIGKGISLFEVIENLKSEHPKARIESVSRWDGYGSMTVSRYGVALRTGEADKGKMAGSLTVDWSRSRIGDIIYFNNVPSPAEPLTKEEAAKEWVLNTLHREARLIDILIEQAKVDRTEYCAEQMVYEIILDQKTENAVLRLKALQGLTEGELENDAARRILRSALYTCKTFLVPLPYDRFIRSRARESVTLKGKKQKALWNLIERQRSVEFETAYGYTELTPDFVPELHRIYDEQVRLLKRIAYGVNAMPEDMLNSAYGRYRRAEHEFREKVVDAMASDDTGDEKKIYMKLRRTAMSIERLAISYAPEAGLIGKYSVQKIEQDKALKENGRGTLIIYAYDLEKMENVVMKIGAVRTPHYAFKNFRKTGISAVDYLLGSYYDNFKKEYFYLKPNPYGIHGIGTEKLLAIDESLKDNDLAVFHEVAHGAIAGRQISLELFIKNIKGGEAALNEFIGKEGKQRRLFPEMRTHYAICLMQNILWPKDNAALTGLIKALPRAAEDIKHVETPDSRAAGIKIPIEKGAVKSAAVVNTGEWYPRCVLSFAEELRKRGRTVRGLHRARDVDHETQYDLGDALNISFIHSEKAAKTFEMYRCGVLDAIGYGVHILRKDGLTAELAFHIFKEYRQFGGDFAARFFEAKLKYLYHEKGIRKFVIPRVQLGSSASGPIDDDYLKSGAIIFFVKKFGFSLQNKKLDREFKAKIASGHVFTEAQLKEILVNNPGGLYLDLTDHNGRDEGADFNEPERGIFEESKEEAGNIHGKNLELMSKLPKQKILCHLISESILPREQRKILVNTEFAMRHKSYNEKIVMLKDNLSADHVGVVKDKITAVEEYYKRELGEEFKNYEFEFDVACVSAEQVALIQDSELGKKMGVKAMAFQQCDSPAQAEGIMLALRALRTGNIEIIRGIFEYLAKRKLTDEELMISDIDFFVRSVTFTLPLIERVDPEDVRRMNHLIRENIKNAA